MSDKPLFDFTKKYTKRSIAEFLLKHGVDKSVHRNLDTPERVESEIKWMCKGKLVELEKMAKLYNASLIFGGDGSFDRWSHDIHQNGAYHLVTKLITNNVVYPQLGVTASELNDVIVVKYRDKIYRHEPDGWIKLSNFTKSLEPTLKELKDLYNNFSLTVKGCHVGTKEEAQDLYKTLFPVYVKYITLLCNNEDFMQFLKEFIEKDLENKE